MLVLKRNSGQWIEITHCSGDVLRVRVYDITREAAGLGRANLAFDDQAKHFTIERPERVPRRTAPTSPSPAEPST